MSSLTTLPAWQHLQDHFHEICLEHMRDMFRDDPARFEHFSVKFNDILLDYSKNRVSRQTMTLLFELARERGLADWIEKMFAGEQINHTEHRAVLHTALRRQADAKGSTGGKDVMTEVAAVLAQMESFSEAVRSRAWRGYTGQPITDIVNIGVGGSDLGPVMATEALKPFAIRDLGVHFVSNVDENHITYTLEKLRPETTLFIIVSKSFTT
ncbi:MAG: glucose-6-phosphate isomerase, partial [Gammaproteobacteria bacterium]|nr:glucose-6-phosphate isomerase [Gammaproteobacteria bacterium]